MAEPIRFETHPSQYRHWKLEVEGAVARLLMNVKEDGGLRPGYPLKLNSYDLSVDLELADAAQRLRFEHPEVRAVVVSSGKDRIFCSGANIYMLGSSTHAFKVNFCKYTNETRLGLEEVSRESGVRFLCAVNGPCAGGGYELALACDEVVLCDDGSSTVSLPEVPLLAVLPGTGGLTRLVDKRKVRRDVADVFCTVAEGVRGKRAKDWGLVDHVVPRSRFNDFVTQRAKELAASAPRKATGPGVALPALGGVYSDKGATYKYVTLTVDPESRVAHLTMKAPEVAQPDNAAAMRELGAELWALRAFRELDDALCTLRFNFETVNVVVVHTEGDAEKVLAVDDALAKNQGDWFVREVTLLAGRVLKRLDLTARSLFALVEEGSCFAGLLLELALASDRTYMKDDPDAAKPIEVRVGAAQGGLFPMGNGLSRLATRLLASPEKASALAAGVGKSYDARDAMSAGLATVTPDALDWEDEVRVAIEERASLSPDALTGMEASLRFAGPETLETKIFGRLSAWQNWIFTRPNATGKRGALTMYGQPERPEFDWKRT